MGQNGSQTNRSLQTLLDQGDTSLCDTIHSHLIPQHVQHPMQTLINIIIGYQVTENRERQRSREHLSCMSSRLGMWCWWIQSLDQSSPKELNHLSCVRLGMWCWRIQSLGWSSPKEVARAPQLHELETGNVVLTDPESGSVVSYIDDEVL